MSELAQWVIVGVLVLGAALFAAWRLMSGALRLRTIESLLRVLPAGNSGLSGRLQRMAMRQRAATGCDACERNPEHRETRRG